MVAASSQPTSTGAGFVPLGAHLVGSVPLASAEAVFRLVAGELGTRVRRIPDGETGPRADWIVWQYPVLSSRPQFEVAPPTPRSYRALPRLRLRPGEDVSALEFDSLGYADAAVASYRTFAVLKRDGVVPRGCRFQVSLPTPLAPVSAFVAVEDQAAVEPPYERAMRRELARIAAEIPNDQLAVQWDTQPRARHARGRRAGAVPRRPCRRARPAPPDRAARPGRSRARVPLLRGPRRAGAPPRAGRRRSDGRPRECARGRARAAASTGSTCRSRRRPTTRPSSSRCGGSGSSRGRRSTSALLHPGEVDEVTERRIALAQTALDAFGVATPCGWGRLAPALVPELVDRHVRLSLPVADASAPGEPFAWPAGFPRIPDEDWVEQPVDAFGLHYDTVENHGWYRNLDLTVEQLAEDLRDGDVLVDYSGGTGILLDRLRLRIFDRRVGMLIVDSSPKFLRVALDRFRGDERVAFRRLNYLKDERRLQYVDEAVGEAFPGADHLVSTNAIHLYDDLDGTLRGWARVLQPGGRVRINSGNLRNPRAGENEWIIDETVYVVHEVATGLVRADPAYAAYRDVLDDEERMRAYLAWRDRVFLAPRPLDFYLDALRGAGFTVEDVSERTIEADVEEWYEFLAAYADAVLGWVGGSAKVDGAPATEEAARDRLALLHRALTTIFGGRPTFRCCWTYITARRS